MRIQAQGQLAVFDKNNSLREEALTLEGKAKEVKLAEQALTVKANLEGMADEHRQRVATSIAQQNEDRIVQREQAIVDTMSQAVSQAMGQVGTEISKLGPMLQQVVAEVKKPKKVKIGNIATDKDGNVTGAEVTAGG